MIKLVAIDLDGTLLNGQKKITPRNQAALMAAKAQGVKVVICTGRPLPAIHPFLKELNLEEAGDYSITFNGGLVQKNDTGEMIEKNVLTFSEVEQLIALAQNLNLPLDLLSEGHVYNVATSVENQSLYSTMNPLLTHIPVAIEDVQPQLVYNKAVIGFEQTFLDAQIQKIPAAIRETFEVIKSREMLLEFMPQGVTKAYGLSLLVRDLGLHPAEVMSIGDEENDLSMIEYAGLGVAMENAVSVVKAAADVVTKSNEEDGVALAVEKYILREGVS
ncbi:Cof-type HAD-IIB family hydrolase [Enterococcus sp. LJL98]